MPSRQSPKGQNILRVTDPAIWMSIHYMRVRATCLPAAEAAPRLVPEGVSRHIRAYDAYHGVGSLASRQRGAPLP